MIADPDVLAQDVVLVVQRRELDDDASDDDRLEHREGVQVAGPPDVDADVEQLRDDGRGRELEGDRPARIATDHPELRLLGVAVDLDHHAVDVVVEVGASLAELEAGGDHRVDVVVRRRQRVDTEAVGLEPRERVGVRCQLETLAHADRIRPQGKGARGRLRGVPLAQRACGGVARVHEGREALRRPLLVEAREGGDRQVDLAAHLDERRRRLALVEREAQGHGAHGAQVGGHVLADDPVAARRSPLEHAVAVDERDREPVDLRLGDVTRRIIASCCLELTTDALVPRDQLVDVARVREREHRLEVPHLLEASRCNPSDALRGRVGRAQARVVLLERLQLAEERVVAAVVDLRRVLDVVQAVVPLELVPQEGGALGGLLSPGVHAGSRRARGVCARSPPVPRRAARPR